ncbi:type IV pilus modification PilV family protein [Rubinisphaera margarita]|uniref:type IV pilus modification PilV family protein n=1 Tax=Rubinisphaera margarita TaxID=2909586 RepID=UPI001EE8DB71|nr:prepilin-type N-terminal cleavage/methylation domain-containing protein [Rubinisphaera margarita]MCG6155844.1 prepilin-type N-terminal cleavage/methylation domain-containing protein [Rubinisphaera margarita]
MNALHRQPSNARKGFSLLEVSICSLLVAVLMIASLRCMGAIVVGREHIAQRAIADQLADELLSEIMEKSYKDSFLPLFGLEALEVGYSNGPRNSFDDVDDYDNWSVSPPRNRDNSTRSNLNGWRREVSVAWVTKANPNQTSITETGLKRIIVTVKRNQNTLAQAMGYRSESFTVAPSQRGGGNSG